MTIAGIGSQAILKLSNKYEFNGNEKQEKEFSDGSGLETMDFNARMYDAQLRRVWQIDPLCEYMRRWSTYSFAFDNPIRFADQSGREPTDSTKPGDHPALFNGEAPEGDGGDPLGVTLSNVTVTSKAKKKDNSDSRWRHMVLHFSVFGNMYNSSVWI